MNRKLILILVALLAMGAGIVLALFAPHSHEGASEHSSNSGAVAAVVASFSAVVVAAAARRKKNNE